MSIRRREFIRLTAGTASSGAALLSGIPSFASSGVTNHAGSESALSHLRLMTGDIVPMSLQERLARVEKAQRLMAENKIDALLLDSGTSMVYFTGINWWPSERTMVAVIPARGEVRYVSPAFEAERLRELIRIGTD